MCVAVEIRFFLLYAGLAGGTFLVAGLLDRRPSLPTALTFVLLPLVFVMPFIGCDKTPLPTDQIQSCCSPWLVPHAPLPYNSTLSDVISQFAPWTKAVRMALKEGSFPWMDRWNGCGTPLAANGQSAAFSPFSVLMLGLPIGRAFALLGATKLFIALMGTYLWLTELHIANEAARFGAVVFALSFTITPWLYHPASSGLALWPWLLFALEYRPVRRRTRFWILVVLCAVWPLCGHLETVAIAALACGVWVLLRSVAGDPTPAGSAYKETVLAVVLGVGLSAFALVPQLMAIQGSNRLAIAQRPDHLDFVPWVPYKPGWLGAIGTSLFPRMYGDGVEAPMIAGAAGSLTEMGFGYIGLVGWICALLSGFVSSSKARCLMILMLGALGTAMGLGIFKTASGMLPGLGLAPPLRFLVVVAMAGTGLGALALGGVIQGNVDQRRVGYWLVTGAVVIAAIGVMIHIHERPLYEAAASRAAQERALWLGLGTCAAVLAVGLCYRFRTLPSSRALVNTLALLAATELLVQGMRLYRAYPTSSLFPDTPLLSFLGKQPGPFRVVGDGLAAFPNLNVFAGLEDVRTHDPVERREYVELLDMTCGYAPSAYIKTLRDLDAPALDFLNVRFLISGPGGQPPGPKWRLVYEGSDGNVFENAQVLPRFYVPASMVVVEAEASTHSSPLMAKRLRPLLASYFRKGQFAEEAIVAPSSKGSLQPGVIDQRNLRLAVSSLKESTNELRLRTRSPVGASRVVLVASIVQDGGWYAEDESSSHIDLCFVNGPFLGIVVPPGDHEIRLVYRPPGLRLGVTVSFVAACVIALIAWRRRT